MCQIKLWVVFAALVSGFALVRGDDHEDIKELFHTVSQQSKQILSLESTSTVITVAVDGLKKAVDSDQKQVHQLKLDVNTGKSERTDLRKDLEETKDKWIKAAAKIEEKMAEEKENASKRMEKLETKLLEEVALSTKRYEHVTDLLRNETERSEALEKRLKAEEAKSAGLQQKLDHQDGVISKIEESQRALVKRVEEVFELLPNATFPNGSSVFHRRLDKLTQIVTKDQYEIIDLRSDVDADTKKLSSTSEKVKSLDGAVNKLVDHDQNMDAVIKTIKDAQERDLEKFHHEQYGFRYTGRGWSYYRYDQIQKKGLHLQECLQFCQRKRAMNPRYDGVNFFSQLDGRTNCYCVEGAHGFNPNEAAMRFIA